MVKSANIGNSTEIGTQPMRHVVRATSLWNPGRIYCLRGSDKLFCNLSSWHIDFFAIHNSPCQRWWGLVSQSKCFFVGIFEVREWLKQGRLRPRSNGLLSSSAHDVMYLGKFDHDLTFRPNPGIMDNEGNHPQMAARFRLVKCYNLPRCIYSYK